MHTSDWVNLSMYNLGLVAAVPTLKVDLGSTIPGDVFIVRHLRRNISILGTRLERKTGLRGKNSQTGGETHFLMSTYQVIFGMPK